MYTRWFFPRKAWKQASRRPPQGLNLELLENRMLLSVAAEEQQFVYLLNRARHDPATYQREAGLSVDLSTVAPPPPLAVNNELSASSQFHANEMATYNYYSHQSQVTGEWPNQMARDQGYPLPSYLPNDQNNIEGIDAGYADPASTLQAFIVDSGVSPPGHRIQLLGMDSFHAMAREIGVGHRFNPSSTYSDYWAVHTAYVNSTDTFLTGVVFNDANSNGQYDAGEGIAGATVTIAGASTTTNDAGGWSIPIANNGTYHVTVSGSTFAGTASADVTVNGANVEADFLSGQSSGIVNFTPPPPLTRSHVASALTHSDEYYAQFVTNAYESYLKREPDAAGLSGWVSALQRGLTDEQLEASFIGSAEYIAQHGGTGPAWVVGLYRDLLGRDPDSQGLQGWLHALQGSVTPSQIAYGFAASPEREAQRVTADYQRYLGRDPEPGSVTQWVDAFLNGASNEDVVAGFVGSQEYFQNHSGDNGDWLTSAYQDILGRAPDQQGYAGWLNALGSGQS